MASGQKIAKTIADKRSQTPLMMWIKSKLFAVYRQDITPPPGPYTPDGKCVFRDPNRYVDEMSARDQPKPNLPDGIYHRLSGIPYFERDARRMVQPSPVVYDATAETPKFKSTSGEPLSSEEAVPINKGPEENFGFDVPTPGTGLEWKRNRKEELFTQKNSSDLIYVEKFDRFLKTK